MRSGPSRALRVVVLVLAWASIEGCQSPLAQGEPCVRSSDCTAPLACAYGRCRVECDEPRDCAAGLRCIDGGGGGVCTFESEEHCTATICGAPLVCVEDRCRTECTTDDDCHGGACRAGSCLEPVVRPPLEAWPDHASGACARQVASPALLDVVLGASASGGGLERLVPARTAPYDAPRLGQGFAPPQLGLAVRRAGTEGEVRLAVLHDGQESGGRFERHARMWTFPVAELSRITDPASVYVGFDAVFVRWIDVGIDGDTFVTVAALDMPDAPGSTSAWMIESPPSGPEWIHSISAGDPPRQQTARTRVVGGRTSFDTSAEGWPLFFVFREDAEGVPTNGSVRRDGAPPPDYVATSTAPLLPEPVIDTAAGEGPLWIGRRASGEIVLWDQRRLTPSPPTLRPLAPLAAGATGAPAIARLGSEPAYGLVAFPRDGATGLVPFTCGLANATPCALGTPSSLGSLTGGVVQAVALAPVQDGYVLATTELGPRGPVVVLRVVDRDGVEVGADVTGELEPVFDGETELARDEALVAVEVAAAPSDAGVSLVVAALVRNEITEQDRVWIGGAFACSGP